MLVASFPRHIQQAEWRREILDTQQERPVVMALAATIAVKRRAAEDKLITNPASCVLCHGMIKRPHVVKGRMVPQLLPCRGHRGKTTQQVLAEIGVSSA